MTKRPTGLLGLAERRKAAGYTQQSLAQLLGVERAALGMWEIGRSWPSAALLPLMADLLLCSIDELYEPPKDPGCNGSAEIIELPFSREEAP